MSDEYEWNEDEVCIFRDDMAVELVDFMGDDDSIIKAAKVSTMTDTAVDEMSEASKEKFIDFLAKNRHGSPFEHVLFTVRIEAPIFVWREFMRHRVASYNEVSGRYRKLEPVFYVPAPDRKIVQVGKPGAYEFVEGEDRQRAIVGAHIRCNSRDAYNSYEAMLEAGVAREVARMLLPLNIYSTAYVTMNLRALTNFLSLRVADGTSMFPSFPQREIEMVAEQMEEIASTIAPKAMLAFQSNGRVPL